jgi:hypothetical protein
MTIVQTTATKTPGYNTRLGVWFATTRTGRRTAWYFSFGAMRAIRVSITDAEIWIAGDLADQACGHPLRPHNHTHAEA